MSGGKPIAELLGRLPTDELDPGAPPPSRLGWTAGVSIRATTNCNRQNSSAAGLAPSSSAFSPCCTSERVDHPRSNSHLPARQPATPWPFAERNISASEAFFRTEETPLGGDACVDAKRPNCAYA
jgi:hypothetical protein